VSGLLSRRPFTALRQALGVASTAGDLPPLDGRVLGVQADDLGRYTMPLPQPDELVGVNVPAVAVRLGVVGYQAPASGARVRSIYTSHVSPQTCDVIITNVSPSTLAAFAASGTVFRSLTGAGTIPLAGVFVSGTATGVAANGYIPLTTGQKFEGELVIPPFMWMHIEHRTVNVVLDLGLQITEHLGTY